MLYFQYTSKIKGTAGIVVLFIIWVCFGCSNNAPAENVNSDSTLMSAIYILEKHTIDKRNKSKEISEEYYGKFEYPDVRYEPYRQMAKSITFSADSFFRFLDSFSKILIDDKSQHLQVSSILPYFKDNGKALSYEMNKTYWRMLRNATREDSVRIDEDIANEHLKSKYQHTRGWNHHNIKRSTPAIVAALEIANIKAQFSDIEQYLVDKTLFQGRSSCGLKFSRNTAIAIPSPTYVFPGDRVRVNVILQSDCDFEQGRRVKNMKVGNNTIQFTNEIGVYESIADKEGIKTILGTVYDVDYLGYEHILPFKCEYLVVKPKAVLTFDHQPAIPVGIPTPVTINFTPFCPSPLQVSINRGIIIGEYDKFVVTVMEPGPVSITVGYKNSQGSLVGLDTLNFEVK
jgi:hypothetical protein